MNYYYMDSGPSWPWTKVKKWTFTVALAFLALFSADAQTYTFTTAGATGINGPTQANINSAYAATNLNGNVTVVGGIQKWEIPVPGIYSIEVYGAKGYGSYGGRGAYLKGEFTFNGNDTLKILVGQQGGCCVGSGTNQYGGGGGTFVVTTNNTPLIIAGGGGGASGATSIPANADASLTTSGKAGQGSSTSGAGGTNGSGGIGGGSGGGGGGFSGDGGPTAPYPGGMSFLNGGQGGSSTSSGGKGGFGGGGGANSSNNNRGGGGGGYSGGGAGASSTTSQEIGGGGGSYNSGANPLSTAALGLGDGQVVITLMSPLVTGPNNVGITALPSLISGICPGPQTLTAKIRNFGTNAVDSVMVGWSVNGVLQSDNWYHVALDTFPVAPYDTIVTLGTYNFGPGVYNVTAWTHLPNNQADTVNLGDTIIKNMSTITAGTPPASFGVCSMDPFTINMAGVTTNVTGVAYQWQERSPAGTGTWTDMIGFINPSLSYPGGVFSSAADYRLIVTCTASNLSDTSNMVAVSVNPPSACYCTPSTQYTSYYMNGVSTSGAIQDITYTQSGFPTGGYVDSMLAVQTFESQATQSFNITAGFSLNTTTKSSFRIWVDWGQDGSFDNSDLVVDDFKSLGGSQTYGVTVPATASMGDYRMRVRYGYTQNPLAPCGQTNYGSTVDFKLHIGTPPSCLAPTNLAAQNITDTTADLTWQENGSATQWQVEYGAFGSIPGAGTTVVTTTNPYSIVLTPSTDYEFRVRAICGVGDTSQWSATTSFTNSYCTFPTQSTTTYYIDKFETQGGLVNISNIGTGLGTNYNGYSDFTNKVVMGYPGQTITATTTMADPYGYGSYGYAVFVDWNGNFIFDPSERVYANNTYGQNPLTGTFTVPNVANGNYRMRIVADYLSTAPDACGGSSYGDAEDYTFSIVTIPTCLPVTNIIEDSVSSSSLQVSWTPGGSETSWIVEWGVPGFTPGTGTGIDSATVSSAIHLITGLNSNTDYDVYIKADCGGGDLSYWASISLITECDIMQALGYCEVFDAASDFNCWSVIDNDNDGNSWVWDNNGNGFDNDGSVTITTYMNAGSNDDYLVMPRMHLTGNEVLKFKYKSRYSFYTQDFDVLISTTNKQASSFTDTLLPVFTFNNDTYMDTTVDLSAYSGDVYIAFHVPVGGIDDDVFYIDNVCINICTPIAGIPGSATICSANGLVDLDSIISSQYGNGSWFLTQNQSAINGSQLDPTYLAEGTYQARYVVYGECTNDTTIATLHISNVSSAGVGTTTTVCKNAKVNLYPLLTGNVDFGGQWLDYQQQPITGSSTTVPSLPGSYNYFYITSNGVCGADTATVVINVDPNCDELSLSGVALDNVNVYPNPTHSVLNINNPSNLNNLKGELIDMKGRLVMNITKAMNEKTTISLENLQKGIYTLRLYNDEGQRIFKVVKE